MASKFSAPFMAKSPLYGAYESGAGAKAYVSNRQAFEKLQDDITSATTSYLNPMTQCPKGKVRSKINNKCVSKKGSGKEYDE